MIVKSNEVIYAMDKENPPVHTVKSGETVTFETLDCFSCELESEEDKLSGVDFNKINPASGPLFIEGAEVGDTLKVTVEKIEVEDQGVSIVEPGLGRLGDKITEGRTRIIQIKDNKFNFQGIEYPLNKMIGVIGTAPKGEPVTTGTPGDHGGNLDCTQITEGNILYLPVNVEGALLSIGDLHAAMGDGEIGGAAVEINGKATVKVEVLKDFKHALPMVETPDKWITLGSRESIDEATDLAISNMADFIVANTKLDFNDATMLMTFVADVIACQIVNPAVTMRVEVPKAIFE